MKNIFIHACPFLLLPFLACAGSDYRIESFDSTTALQSKEKKSSDTFLSKVKHLIRGTKDAPKEFTNFVPLPEIKGINLRKYKESTSSGTGYLSKLRSWIHKLPYTLDARYSERFKIFGYNNDYDYRLSDIFTGVLKKSLMLGIASYAANFLPYVSSFLSDPYDNQSISGVLSAGKIGLALGLLDWGLNGFGVSRYNELGRLSQKTNEDYVKIKELLKKTPNSHVLIMPKSLFEESILPGMSKNDANQLEARYSYGLISDKQTTEDFIVLRNKSNKVGSFFITTK